MSPTMTSAVVDYSGRRPDSWPYLPTEIIQQTIAWAWSLPMTGDERIEMLTSLSLVDKNILATINRLSMQDVHIATADYAYRYLDILRSRTSAERAAEAAHPSLTTLAPALADGLCRSITFHIPRPADAHTGEIRLYRARNPMGAALSATLDRIDAIKYVPGLTRLAVEYTDWGYNDVFDHDRLLNVPQSVRVLELRFRYGTEAGARVLEGLGGRYFGRPRCGAWALPAVRELVIEGVACLDFVVDTMQVCEQLERLELSEVRRMDKLAPLSPSVNTLVLRAQGALLDEDLLKKMELTLALRKGLFSEGGRSRIEIETSGAQSDVLQHLTEVCRSHNIDLVHREVS